MLMRFWSHWDHIFSTNSPMSLQPYHPSDIINRYLLYQVSTITRKRGHKFIFLSALRCRMQISPWHTTKTGGLLMQDVRGCLCRFQRIIRWMYMYIRRSSYGPDEHELLTRLCGKYLAVLRFGVWQSRGDQLQKRYLFGDARPGRQGGETPEQWFHIINLNSLKFILNLHPQCANWGRDNWKIEFHYCNQFLLQVHMSSSSVL